MTEKSNECGVAPLLERAYIFLSDGNFDKADEYAEKILDIEPKNPEAYVCKLLAEFKAEDKDSLRFCGEDIQRSANYKKSFEFGDESCKKFLSDSLKTSLEIKGYRDRIESIEKAVAHERNLSQLDKGMADVNRQAEKNVNHIFKQCRKWAILHFVAIGILLSGIAAVVIKAVVLEDILSGIAILLLGTLLMLGGIVFMIVTFSKMHSVNRTDGEFFKVLIYSCLIFFGAGIIWGIVVAIRLLAQKNDDYSGVIAKHRADAAAHEAKIGELNRQLQQAKRELRDYIDKSFL